MKQGLIHSYLFVTDGNGGADSISVTINVTDVDEVANNAPVFTDGTSTTRAVAENTVANTNIGTGDCCDRCG